MLLIVLDLDNPSVTDLPLGQPILAAVFQAASSRHTGTSTFNLNPPLLFCHLQDQRQTTTIHLSAAGLISQAEWRSD
jgi:hypothetical protein